MVRVSRASHVLEGAPTGPALIVDRDLDGWFRVRWLQPPDGLYLPDGLDRWMPPSKLVMISRACEKDEESFKKDA
ncbi:MAG: hypothetical protein F3745_00030 [Nitrospinae bacterium]|nr:hypothetical protein [Nitrospinota bacterium]